MATSYDGDDYHEGNTDDDDDVYGVSLTWVDILLSQNSSSCGQTRTCSFCYANYRLFKGGKQQFARLSA